MAKSKFEKLSREMEEREGFGNSLIIFVIAALIVSVLGLGVHRRTRQCHAWRWENCIYHPEPNGPII